MPKSRQYPCNCAIFAVLTHVWSPIGLLVDRGIGRPCQHQSRTISNRLDACDLLQASVVELCRRARDKNLVVGRLQPFHQRWMLGVSQLEIPGDSDRKRIY